MDFTGTDFKVVVIGDANVGKTTFIKRHLTGDFTTTYEPTVGTEISTLRFQTTKGVPKFVVWDCAGQEQFSGLRDGYWIGASYGIVMFDVTSRKSYYSAREYVRDLRMVCGDIPIVLCGNKVDSRKRVIFQQEIVHDKYYGCYYFDISCKSTFNTGKVFGVFCKSILGNDTKFVQPEDVPVEDVQPEDVLVEDVLVEDVLVEDVLVEDVLVEDVLVEDVLVEDVPVEDVPVEDVPVEDVPVEDVPVEDVPVEDVPVEDVPNIPDPSTQIAYSLLNDSGTVRSMHIAERGTILLGLVVLCVLCTGFIISSITLVKAVVYGVSPIAVCLSLMIFAGTFSLFKTLIKARIIKVNYMMRIV
jgi:GTP-binding nuclear protein Ran